MEDYVVSAQDGLIQVVSKHQEHHQALESFGGKHALLSRDKWTLPFSSEQELALVFSALRNMGFAFAGDVAGWPPAAIFEDLRDKCLLEGKFIEVVWSGRDHVMKAEK